MERPKTKYHYDNNKSSLCCFSQRQVQKGKKHTPHVCSDKNSIVIEKVELIIICDYRAFMNKEQHCHCMSAIYKKNTEFDNEITIYQSYCRFMT